MKYVLRIQSWNDNYVEIFFGDYVSVGYDNDPSVGYQYTFEIDRFNYLKYSLGNYKNVRLMVDVLIGYLKLDELKERLMKDWK